MRLTKWLPLPIFSTCVGIALLTAQAPKTFKGRLSPATIAQLHKSPVRGVRGPVVFDLTVTKTDASSGTLNGAFDLTPLQAADLEKGRLYVQVHSEKAPDGNLWGWLLPQENKR
jgi:hypothetical protein